MRQAAMVSAFGALDEKYCGRLLGAAAAALVAAGCSGPKSIESVPDAAVTAAPDQTEILEDIDAFFLAFAAGDADAVEALLTPDAITVALHPEDASQPPRRGRAEALIAAMRGDDFPHIVEPYWSPTVLQRGPLAVVWAPYEVSVNGEFAHCGIDVFSMSREDGVWKIDAISWTAEPSACDELRPGDKSLYRPKFPSGE